MIPLGDWGLGRIDLPLTNFSVYAKPIEATYLPRTIQSAGRRPETRFSARPEKATFRTFGGDRRMPVGACVGLVELLNNGRTQTQLDRKDVTFLGHISSYALFKREGDSAFQ
jgi:hypothetical protein